MRAVALVAIGSAAGGVARYFAGVWLTRADFPWGTLAVNLVGSFLIGVLLFGGLARGTMGPDARVLVATGILGGFTTMSSFAYETVSFVEDAEALRAFAYASLTFVGALAMAFAGRALGTWWAGGA